MIKKLYYLPEYYDIAFSYELSGEIQFFTHCFSTYADFDVRRILEPACGSGRLLIPLARSGYHVLGYNICKMQIEDSRNGKTFMFIEPHILRLWYLADFKRLSRAGGFVLKAIYNQSYERVPLDSPITGELGNHYFILKKE